MKWYQIAGANVPIFAPNSRGEIASKSHEHYQLIDNFHKRFSKTTTNMNNIPQIFFSTTTTSSIFLPFFLFIFSVFIYFFYQCRPDSIPPPSRSRKNETKYVDAAIERALEMRSIVSKMPSDSPHIPERGLDYRTKRNIVLENRWWWDWWIWGCWQWWRVCTMMLRSKLLLNFIRV